MGSVTINNSLPDPEIASRFSRGILMAVEPYEGVFVAWIKRSGPEAQEVRIHLEEPARKETLGGVVEPWKRSVHMKARSSEEEVRGAMERLLRS